MRMENPALQACAAAPTIADTTSAAPDQGVLDPADRAPDLATQALEQPRPVPPAQPREEEVGLLEQLRKTCSARSQSDSLALALARTGGPRKKMNSRYLGLSVLH